MFLKTPLNLLLFIKQVTKPNSMKNFLARIQNLASILQVLNSGKIICKFLVARTNKKPNELTSTKIFDQQN